jgi:hypothetical protein
MRLNTMPIFLAFFLMGLADAMGPKAEDIKAVSLERKDESS